MHYYDRPHRALLSRNCFFLFFCIAAMHFLPNFYQGGVWSENSATHFSFLNTMQIKLLIKQRLFCLAIRLREFRVFKNEMTGLFFWLERLSLPANTNVTHQDSHFRDILLFPLFLTWGTFAFTLRDGSSFILFLLSRLSNLVAVFGNLSWLHSAPTSMVSRYSFTFFKIEARKKTQRSLGSSFWWSRIFREESRVNKDAFCKEKYRDNEWV